MTLLKYLVCVLDLQIQIYFHTPYILRFDTLLYPHYFFAAILRYAVFKFQFTLLSNTFRTYLAFLNRIRATPLILPVANWRFSVTTAVTQNNIRSEASLERKKNYMEPFLSIRAFWLIFINNWSCVIKSIRKLYLKIIQNIAAGKIEAK